VPAVALDARLLDAGPAALEAALADHLGEPLLVRFEPVDAHVPPEVAHFLRHVPALTLGVGPRAPVDELDLVTEETDRADRWCAAFEQSPHAVHAAALLVRRPPPDAWTGLIAESGVYSMLLASPRFLEWRAARRPSGAEDRAPRVRVEQHGPVTDIVLTRPAKHNALDVRMREELFAALGEALASDRPVVVRGDGPSFCSGGDLDEFGTFPDPASAHAIRLGRSLAWRFHELSPRLVVAVHGACLGAGIELPAFASTVIAADDAVCGLPEPTLGLVPGAGGTVSIPRRAGRARFLELLLTDGSIPAVRAKEWGLVDEVVPQGALVSRAREVARSLT
jgi:enoyl-CoA hydratase/carnithine racemase